MIIHNFSPYSEILSVVRLIIYGLFLDAAFAGRQALLCLGPAWLHPAEKPAAIRLFRFCLGAFLGQLFRYEENSNNGNADEIGVCFRNHHGKAAH